MEELEYYLELPVPCPSRDNKEITIWPLTGSGLLWSGTKSRRWYPRSENNQGLSVWIKRHIFCI